jgi:hypothetical protein
MVDGIDEFREEDITIRREPGRIECLGILPTEEGELTSFTRPTVLPD